MQILCKYRAKKIKKINTLTLYDMRRIFLFLPIITKDITI